MYTHAIQHSFPQQTLDTVHIPRRKTLTPESPQVSRYFFKNRNYSNPETKPKNRSTFSSKLKAILKPQPTPRVPKSAPNGKKVTWNLDEEQIQPGESSVREGEAWPSPDSEDRQVNNDSIEPDSYVMSRGISSDEDITPTRVCHERQENLYESIIPIHTRTLNPLRAAAYLPKVSHKHSSSLPNEEIQDKNQVSDHKRVSSLDLFLEPKVNYKNHQQAPWYKQANVDWTKNMMKQTSGAKPTPFDLNSWSEKNRNQSILDDLSQFLDDNIDIAVPNKRTTFPISEDQISMIESEASSNVTFFEQDDGLDNTELPPFMFEPSVPVQQYQPRSIDTILPPVHHQPSRGYQENYIILPMQSYGVSTVCEVTFSSQITLLPSYSLTEITFVTDDAPSTPIITKTNSPTIYELSDRQCPPYYINTSTSLPQLDHITKSNPRMSYRQMNQEGKRTTLPRAKKHYRSPYQHIPEDSRWIKQNSAQPIEITVTASSGSEPYLDCDKSTGQMISPSIKRVPFNPGYLGKNNPPIRSATSFSHINTNSRHTAPMPIGSLKCSYSASCVRDDYQNQNPYVCYTASDATPAYIPQDTQSPYMNIDMFASNERMNQYFMLEGPDTNIMYRSPPRYFTPHPLGVCCECKEYIYPAPCQPVRIKNRMFHPDCFKCSDCYCLLHVLSYQEVQGKFYCPRDFEKHILCHVCKQPLASYRGRDIPVNIYDKFFHPQCYRCTSCNTQNQKLSFDGRWLLCLNCTQARRQQTIKPLPLKQRATLVTLL